MPVLEAPLGLANLRVVASERGELVLSSPTDAVFVDAKTWPPQVVHRAGHVRFAARQSAGEDDGAWWTYTTTDPTLQRWTFRVFASIAAGEPIADEPDALPLRDLTPYRAELDEQTREREHASAHRIESLEICGSFPVVVPRGCGLGELRRPWVRRAGAWREEPSLPALDRSLEHAATARCLDLNSDVALVVWQGRLYASNQGGFVEYGAAAISDRAVAVRDKVFALEGRQLVEVSLEEVREHLPGVAVHELQHGPHEMLIVETSDGRFLYDPAAHELAALADVLGGHPIAAASDDGGLVTFDAEHALLRRIGPEVLAALPRRPVELPPAPPAPPVRILDARGAAARPITAAAGDVIISCSDEAVRFWNLDLPFAKVGLAALAVAVRDGRVAVLDDSGVLHELELATGAILGSRPVTDRPRSLARTADRWVVIAEDAVWLVGARLERIEIAGAIAAAADPDGGIVILAEDRRLARWEAGQLLEIPESVEQLVAIAALGGRRFVCAGERNLFLLDLAQLELEALYAQNESPFLAASPDGQVVAWATHQHVWIGRLAGTTLEVLELSSYPDTFLDPKDEPLRVRGLAFLDDRRLTVAINAGCGGDLLDFVSRTSKKLDPHPGDTRNRYLHTYAGKVLICEDP